jgi:predicted polyphosphate/ATP-dependent NAD kinase
LVVAGIIANPAAGKDIRRLVAHGRVVPDWEKVNVIRRVFLGMEAVGLERVVVMPNSSYLCQRARDDVQLSLELDVLDMPVYGSVDDTVAAAAMMKEMEVGCLVTLGGDGTNRAVAKACGPVPLVPISTGTNNVFPAMMEGTLAGLAAGVVALGLVELDRVSAISKRIEVYLNGEFRDLALVDLAVSGERFVASRAIWDMSTLREVFLTRAEPTSIGLSSIGARLHPVSMTDETGLYFRPGPGGTTVLAPVAPGIVSQVPIQEWRILPLGERVPIHHDVGTIALDGEREFSLLPGQRVEVELTGNGPRVVLLEAALREATSLGVFASQSDGIGSH